MAERTGFLPEICEARLPELPEVETVRLGLAPLLEGQRIDAVRLNRADLRFPFPERFVARLEGRRIGPLGRRAKFLLLPLDSGETLIIHLGMSGRLILEQGAMRHQPGDFYDSSPRLLAHDHVEIGLGTAGRLVYNDVRRFGFMLLVASASLDAHPMLAELGPEPLGNAFHAGHLTAVLAGRALPLKAALLDQTIVAGLGNIYVVEALHRAGLSPFRAARDVNAIEVERLVRAIRAVLEAAIAAGGSTLRDYRHEDGTPGAFQNEFRVYDREGAPCPHPGCQGLIERQVQSGRSSFFCGLCQT